MMWRWIFPILVGGLIALGAYQATLLATPYALMFAAMKKIGERSPENQFAFGPMTTADNQTIVRPSPDLAYATCTFDLSKGPVHVDVQPIPDHYWSVSVFDARTDVAAVRSDRDTKGAPARLALIKPGQTAPWVLKDASGEPKAVEAATAYLTGQVAAQIAAPAAAPVAGGDDLMAALASLGAKPV
jgi:uncharacterized membrane protein